MGDYAEGDERGAQALQDVHLYRGAPRDPGSGRHYTIADEAAARPFLGHGRHLGTGLLRCAARPRFKISTVKVSHVPCTLVLAEKLRAISLSLVDPFV